MIRLWAEQIKTPDGGYINGIQVMADVEDYDIHGYRIRTSVMQDEPPIIVTNWHAMGITYNPPYVMAEGKPTQNDHKTRIPNYSVDHNGEERPMNLFQIYYSGGETEFSLSGALLLGSRVENWQTAEWINGLTYSMTLTGISVPDIEISTEHITIEPPVKPFWKAMLHDGSGMKDISDLPKFDKPMKG